MRSSFHSFFSFFLSSFKSDTFHRITYCNNILHDHHHVLEPRCDVDDDDDDGDDDNYGIDDDGDDEGD